MSFYDRIVFWQLVPFVVLSFFFLAGAVLGMILLRKELKEANYGYREIIGSIRFTCRWLLGLVDNRVSKIIDNVERIVKCIR